MSQAATGARGLQDTSRNLSALPYLVYCEVLKLFRIPIFALGTFLFPILFFAMFGLPYVNYKLGGIDAGRYMMVSYGTYAIMATALFSFGSSIAAERGLGWNRLLRATPMRSITYFAAKIVMAALFGMATLTALFTFGALVGGVHMGAGLWVETIGLLVFGMVPFVTLGLFVGYVTGPNSSAIVVQFIFIPLAFASGLFIPLDGLPRVVQDVAPYLPSYHIAQLGWTALGSGDGDPAWMHALWISGYTLVFLAMAAYAYRRDEGRTFG